MQPSVSYIPYVTFSHVKTGNIITLEQFEGGNLSKNEWNLAKDELILASIDE